MKKLSMFAIGTALITLAVSPTNAQTSGRGVLGGGDFLWSFTGSEQSAFFEMTSTSNVYGFTGDFPERQSFGVNRWRGDFTIYFDEAHDDEIDIFTRITHSSLNSGFGQTYRNNRGLHAEENSNSISASNVASHGAGVDIFSEILTWKSHEASCCFDRDEIDSWSYQLNARHLDPGVYKLPFLDIRFTVNDGKILFGGASQNPTSFYFAMIHATSVPEPQVPLISLLFFSSIGLIYKKSKKQSVRQKVVLLTGHKSLKTSAFNTNLPPTS
jgi:hypothetical protein